MLSLALPQAALMPLKLTISTLEANSTDVNAIRPIYMDVFHQLFSYKSYHHIFSSLRISPRTPVLTAYPSHLQVIKTSLISYQLSPFSSSLCIVRRSFSRPFPLSRRLAAAAEARASAGVSGEGLGRLSRPATYGAMGGKKGPPPQPGVKGPSSLFILSDDNILRKYTKFMIEWPYPFMQT